MKIATVYTGKPPQLIINVETALKSELKKENFQILMFSDPTLISETIANSKVTYSVAKRLINLYMAAIESGAEIIYNICSSVGEVADVAKDLFEMMGVPLIRIDEEMAINAINSGRRIGVLASLKTTMDPTKRLLLKWAKILGKDVEIIEALAETAFRKSQEEMDQILIEKVRSISKKVELIVLAQASMAASEEAISHYTGKKVFSSPRFGAIAVSKAIKKLKEEN